MAALEKDGSEWALKELETLRRKSPMACKVSLRLLERSMGLRDFAGEMGMEYALMAHVAAYPDFAEGVRALLVDKDNQPVWKPSTPEEVTDEMVEAMFEPLAPQDSWSPLPLARNE
jgi:enoyl-CoA hydratase